MEITYTKQGDYLIPDLTLGEPETRPIGKYGMMRKTFLKNHKKGIFAELVLTEKLNSHLADINETAREQVKATMAKMAKEQGVTEDLKMKDQMKWVGMMNMIKHQAEEAVLHDLIYS